MSVRGRRSPPTDPDARVQQRLRVVEGRPEPWRASSRSDDSGPQKTIRGTFNTTTPSITLGAGYTLTRTGVGAVTINFTVPFRTAPSVVANADAGGGLSCFCRTVGTPTTTSAQIQVIATSGAAQDSAVNFIAVGPA